MSPMGRSEPGIGALQRWFLAVIAHPEGVAAGAASPGARAAVPEAQSPDSVIARPPRTSAADRLGIYARAYFARLIECLGDSFPALKRLLGEELFDGFAFDYLKRHPSRSYTLGRLGEGFPAFLQATRPRGDGSKDDASGLRDAWPDLVIDLARLEWAIAEVFDADGFEGRRTLTPEDLARIPASRWPAVRLVTVPCLRLLRFRFPVSDYCTALRREGPEPPPPELRDSYVAVTRRAFIVRRHSLSRPQFELLAALQRGEALGDAIRKCAASAGRPDASLAPLLRAWFRTFASRQYFEAVRGPASGEAKPPNPGSGNRESC